MTEFDFRKAGYVPASDDGYDTELEEFLEAQNRDLAPPPDSVLQPHSVHDLEASRQDETGGDAGTMAANPCRESEGAEGIEVLDLSNIEELELDLPARHDESLEPDDVDLVKGGMIPTQATQRTRLSPHREAATEAEAVLPAELPSSVEASLLSSPRLPTPPPSSLRPSTPAPPSHSTFAVVIPLLTQTAPALTETQINEAWAAPERTLRERKAIQKHPYLYEQHQYRSKMVGHGIKPIRIREEEQEKQRKKDSEEDEYAPAPEPERRRRRENRSSRQSSTNLADRFTPVSASDENRQGSGYISSGAKRRKVTQPYSKEKQRQDNARNNVKENAGFSASAREVHIFDGPNSPSPVKRPPLTHRSPNSRPQSVASSMPTAVPGGLLDVDNRLSGSESDTNPDLNAPASRQGTSPIAVSPSVSRGSSPSPDSSPLRASGRSGRRGRSRPLPTPKSSSPQRSRTSSPRLRAISVNSGSPSPSPSLLIPSRSPSPDFSRAMRRRLNGVLPASYVTVNAQEAEAKKRRRQLSRTNSPPPINKPGVARAKKHLGIRSTAEEVYFSGASSSSEPEVVERRPVSRNGEHSNTRQDNERFDGDVIEEDKIDHMLPTVSRNRTSRPRDKRTRGAHRVSANSRPNTSSRKYTQTTLNGLIRRKPLKPAGPRLGIVDSVSHLYNRSKDVPPFLRLAVRQAKKRKDLGRHSPSRKAIRLDTATATQEAQGTVREWREGTLPFAPPATATRRQLSPSDRVAMRSGPSQKHRAPRIRTVPARPRQPTIYEHFSPEALSRPAEPNRRKRIPPPQRNPITVLPGGSSYISHQPRSAPQPAQFERPHGSEYRSYRLPPSRLATPLLEALTLRGPVRPYLDKISALKPAQSEPAQRAIGRLRVVQVVPTEQEEYTGLPPPQLPSPRPRRERMRRKHTPTRADWDTVERRQPRPEDVVDVDEHIEPLFVQTHNVAPPILTGLLPYGRRYTTSFDITPLRPGTHFNGETYIGMGYLLQTLTTKAQVSSSCNVMNISFGDKIFKWGAYEDSVAGELEQVLDNIGEVLQEGSGEHNINFDRFASQTYAFFGQVAGYTRSTLVFPDAVDVFSFCKRALHAVEKLCDSISLCATVSLDPARVRLGLQVNALCLAFAFQIGKLVLNVDDLRQLELERIICSTGRQLFRHLLRYGLQTLQDCYERQRSMRSFERGITAEHYVVELWVIAVHVLGTSPETGFWGLVNQELHLETLDKSTDAKLFEKLWQNLFTLVPLYQFGCDGTARSISEASVQHNWALCKLLGGKLITLYNQNEGQGLSSLNEYMRALHGRCYRLMTIWEWKDSDIIIPILYALFANNGLQNLKDEDDHGSPDFICNLDKESSPALLQLYESDRCFVMFLKMFAISLYNLRQANIGARQTKNRISNLVVRCTPNHTRQYPREAQLRVEDLAALRNHHSLLETMYWAAPERRIELLEPLTTLVDPDRDHTAACNVAVRAWTNLIRYQLHAGEEASNLTPFMSWFDSILRKTLTQHNSVPNEAKKDPLLEKHALDSLIRTNRKPLEGILNDLVKSLGDTIASIRGNVPAAVILLSKSATTLILDSYTRIQDHKLTVEVLELIHKYVIVCNVQRVVSVEDTDESQDYGSLDYDCVDALDAKPAAEHILSETFTSLRQMITSCFGRDDFGRDDEKPPEALLTKAVEVWAEVCAFIVRCELKEWNNFLPAYTEGSWLSMRDTENTRKYTALFMTKILQADPKAYEDTNLRQDFLTSWMRSLVERESLLKFQNEYTAILMNKDPTNPMLHNLPFERDSNGVYTISQRDFKSRRLSLLSTLLSNMRDAYDAVNPQGFAFGQAPTSGPAFELKIHYGELIKVIMQSMKKNYREVKSSRHDQPGTYVEFVHEVVQYLQQFSIEIVKVDDFFTDSSAFPLPATDPTYVIGRLRSYVPKLANDMTRKQLVVFFHVLCERTAAEGKQLYLAQQLFESLQPDFEAGNEEKPTLRAYFLQGILLPYIEQTFGTPGAWILVAPVLVALEKVLHCLKFETDSALYCSVRSTISILAGTLDSMRLSVNRLMENNISFTSPHVRGTLILMLRIVIAIIPLLNRLQDSCSEDDAEFEVANDSATFLIRFANYAMQHLVPRQGIAEEVERPFDHRALSKFETPFNRVRTSGEDHLANALKQWRYSNGVWYNSERRAITEPQLPGEGEQEFEMVVQELFVKAARTELFVKLVRTVDENTLVLDGRGRMWEGRSCESRNFRGVLGLADVIF